MLNVTTRKITILRQCCSFWATVSVRPMISDRCLSVLSVCLSVCDVGVLWPNGWMDQDATWYAARPQLTPYSVRLGPLPRMCTSQFLAHICCGQITRWVTMPLGREVCLSPTDIVLDGDPASPPKGGGAPHFLAHVYCGQTPEWIKMSLGTAVGHGPAMLC